ncbi:hypothetical protein [Kribbella deserti]|uniref:Uncharacterized protein n=1 Tax=Kribbella deserti TaxID=1926257 RepID=A0ABV6QMK4_9ACTN
MSIDRAARKTWESLRAAELELADRRRDFLALPVETRHELLAAGLESPAQRGTALRMIEFLEIVHRLEYFPQLVRLASSAHADTMLVRQVIAGLPRPWVHSFLKDEMWPILAQGDDEEFRRFAELLTEIGPEDLLLDLVDLARASSDADIREVAEDFGKN